MAYDLKTKEVAEELRSNGKTYSFIVKELGVPKSTLSIWFNKTHAHIFDKEKQIEHLKRARKLATISKRKNIVQRSLNISKKIKEEISGFPLRDVGLMKTILASLYWAEGSKHKTVSGLILVNTDPVLLNLYITLLRKCFDLDESKFRIRLQIHYYHDKDKCLKYWSNLLGVSKNQFGKFYIKERSKTKKFRENFMGICSVAYLDSNIRRELMEIANQLQKYYCG